MKELPSTEILAVTCTSKKGVFYITRKGESFFLYKQEGDVIERIEKKGVPDPTVYDKVIW